MKQKTSFLFTVMLWLLFLVFVLLLKTVDIAAIGPQGTEIGLSHLNAAIFNAIGTHDFWYRLTQALGYASLLVAGFFAAFGAWQFIRQKSLKKVDLNLIELGGLYVILLGLYAAFEKIVINYRPVLMPGETIVEPSFPSSHTMLAFVIFGSAAMQIPKYIHSAPVRKILKALCYVLIVLMVCGRLLSGVHWFTDIFAGVMLSLALLSTYSDIADKTHALN